MPQFSKPELSLLRQVALGRRTVADAAKAMKKSVPQAYKTCQNLKKKGIVTLEDGQIAVQKNTHARLLVQLLADYESLIDPLSNSGVAVLTAILEPKTLKELIKTAGASRNSILAKLAEARKISLIKKTGRAYALNTAIWPNVATYLEATKAYEDTIDARVPQDATIYHKDKRSIVFSTRTTIDATLTAFSAYEDYGIRILAEKPFYCLPKTRPDIRDVFMHSLYVTEREPDYRKLTYVTLFYAKHRNKLRGVEHSLLTCIKQVLAGQIVAGYPILAELREKAKVYDIEL